MRVCSIFVPVVSKEPDGRKFELGVGGERKTTGSYYTRPELVRELIQSALIPVLEDRLAEVEKLEKGQPAETVQRCEGKSHSRNLGLRPCLRFGAFPARSCQTIGKGTGSHQGGRRRAYP